MILERLDARGDGIFGVLMDDEKVPIAATLEHAYFNTGVGPERYKPIFPDGIYQCKRGEHTIGYAEVPFVTFNIIMPNHYGILFHKGNFNCDSAGCVLLGTKVVNSGDAGQALWGSEAAFEAFMKKLVGVNQFELFVTTA